VGVVMSVKPIRPKRLRVDAVRLEILNALRAEGREQVDILRQTVQGWQGETPSFEALIGLGGGDATLIVGPTGSEKAVQKWQWLDEGTRPHPITARRAPLLKFRTLYAPSTTVGEFTSRGSMKYGPWAARLSVQHPGTQARGWSSKLQQMRKQRFVDAMNDALRRGMDRAL